MAVIREDNVIKMVRSLEESNQLTQVIGWSMDAKLIKLGIHISKKRKPLAPDTHNDHMDKALNKLESQSSLRSITAPDTNNEHMDKPLEELRVKSSKSNTQLSNANSAVPNYYKGPKLEDKVTIIDVDANGINKGISKIVLPFVPKEINYNTESSFASIRTIGRNNPKYHYTGSEDRVEFEIDWYSFEQGREDVIRNCRLIEALSKSDGYSNPPHKIMLQWGEANQLFQDMYFIVISAPYVLSQFNKAQMDGNAVKYTGMLPIQATQKVTLSRITSSNLSKKDIEHVGIKNSTRITNYEIPPMNQVQLKTQLI